MKKLNILLILTIILQTSFVLGALKDSVRSATTNYLQSHFLNASFMFGDGINTIVLGARGIYNLDGIELVPEHKIFVAPDIVHTMCTIAVLKLYDKQLLNLYDSIVKYIDNNMWPAKTPPKWAHKITIHHLLTNTSGLTNIDVNKNMSSNEGNKATLWLASIRHLSFEPGTKYEYSNTNLTLLELIIEKVSGSQLRNFLKKELFDYLEMKSTHLISLEESSKMRGSYYSGSYPEKYLVVPNNTNRPIFNVIEAKSLPRDDVEIDVISNVRDLIKLNRALHSGKLLSEKSYKLMTKRYMAIPSKYQGQKSYIGYGLFITALNNQDIMYHNSGVSMGMASEIGYVTNKNFYFAILSNTTQHIPNDISSIIDLKKPENQLDISYFRDAILSAVLNSNDN